MTKKHLINEYKRKICLCEASIKGSTKMIAERRQDGMNGDSYFYTIDELSKDRKIEDTKRQSYFQFVKDLESLD